MKNIDIFTLVNTFELEPHPEGGFYKETYRAKELYDSLPKPFSGSRNYSTAIYFLIPEGKKSALHKILSDEVWHFYLGGPMTLYQISPNGELEIVTLGNDIIKGQKLQHVVPAGYWFGGHTNTDSEYSFVGCTVSPGFDFRDFLMAERSELIKKFPQHQDIVERLT